MRALKALTALALLSPAVSYAVCVGTWTGASSTNWNAAGNWTLAGCGAETYPGDTAGTTDQAVFAGAGVGTVNVNASPLNLNELSFTTTGGYTLSGANTITFVGASSTLTTSDGVTNTISAPISMNTTNLAITIGNTGDILTLSGGITDAATSGITVEAGSAANGQLNFRAPVTLAGPCAVNNATVNVTSQFTVSNTLTVGGGTVNIDNASTSTPSCNQPNLIGSSVMVTGGSVLLNSANACPVTSGIGTQFGGNTMTGSLNVSGGAISGQNTSAVSTAAGGSAGVLVAAQSVVLSGGSVTLANGTVAGPNGVISGNSSNAGVFLYDSDSSSSFPLTISGAAVTLSNHGSVTGSASVVPAGVKVVSGVGGANPLIVSAGSLEMTNFSDLSTYGNGCYVNAVSLAVSGTGSTAGTFVLQNSGTAHTGLISNAADGVFGAISINATGSMSGIIHLTNEASLDATSTGTGCSATGTSFTIPALASNSEFTVANQAAISGGIGASLIIPGPITLIGTNGSVFNVTNSGSVASAGLKGSYALASGGSGVLTLGGPFLDIDNSATISTTTSPAYGSMVEAASISTMNNGSQMRMVNEMTGTISGNTGNIGAYLYSHGTFTYSGIGLFANNFANVGPGTGVQIHSDADIELQGGANTLQNVGLISSGYGTLMSAGTNLNLNTLFTQLNITNTASSSGGTGAAVTVGGTFGMTTGTLTVSNTGVLSGSANGAVLQVNGASFIQSGGTINVQNTGSAATGNASYIQSTPTIQISGSGTTFNNPNALVAASAVTISNNGTLQSGMGTVPGVFADASFGSTTVINNNGGVFVSGNLDPAPAPTTVHGTFNQNSGTFTVVIGNLNLPGNQGVSFLTVDGTPGSLNFNGGTLVVVPATGFVASDVPASINMVQFAQALSVTGGFTPSQIINTVPGLFSFRYETLGGNQAWLFFSHTPPITPIPPKGSPPIDPGFPIIVTTFNMLNNFLDNEFLRMQDQFDSGGQSLCDGGNAECRDKLRGPKKRYRPHWVKREKSEDELRQECAIKPWHVYLGPLGECGEVNNRHHSPGADFNAIGGLAGFDYSSTQVGGGFMFDYEHVHAKLHKHSGNFDIDQFHATAYTTYVPPSIPQFALNGQIGAGGAWYDVHRRVAAPTGTETAKGNTRGMEFNARMGMQYTFAHRQFNGMPCNLSILPAFNLQYLYQGVAGYKEHGAGINDYKYKSEGYQSLRSTLGTQLQYIVRSGNFSFIPLINLGWQFEFLNQHLKTRASPIDFDGPSQSLTIYGGGRNTFLGGLSLAFEFFRTYTIETIYNFEYNSHYRNNSLILDLNVNF